MFQIDLPARHAILLKIILAGARLLASDLEFRRDAKELVLGELARHWGRVMRWARVFHVLIGTCDQASVCAAIGPQVAFDF